MKASVLNLSSHIAGDINFPEDFRFNLMGRSPTHAKALERYFSSAWRNAWDKIAESRAILHQEGKADSTTPQFPGASNRYERFKECNGLEFLKTLSIKEADPNFILDLFIMYLWNDMVNSRANNSPHVIKLKESLEAVQTVRDYYLKEIKNVWESLHESDSGHPELITEVVGSKPREEFELALSEIEQKIMKYLGNLDFLRPGRRGLSRDKENRVIYIIYEHLMQRTGRPHWQIVLDLLVAAGAIEVDKKKKREGKEGVINNPDRRVMTRIRTFRGEHPNEARYIREQFLTHHPVK